MNESTVVGGSLLLAVALAGIAGLLTGSVSVLGVTPLGVAIYLAVGIGLPQYMLGRQRGSPLRVGLAALALIGAVLAVAAGVLTGTTTQEANIGIISILVVVVFGTLLGAVVREFRAGYRAGS